MPVIENVSGDAVRQGDHTDMGPDAILIQITDPASEPPIPKQDFHCVFHLEFLDIEDPDVEKHPDMEEFAITQAQADRLVEILQIALKNNQNVLVHCYAGICRSGAVAEVGSILGFTPTNRFRQPNLRVKHRMMKSLGLTYDSDEKSMPINAGGLWSIDG